MSRYDELLELNRRRIALLEKMSKELYREWFVRLRFPGYQDAEFYKGLPCHWTPTKIGDVISFDKGLSYSGKHLCEKGEGVPLVNLKCFRIGGHFRPDGVKFYDGDFTLKHIVQGGDIVVANTDLTQSGGIIGNPAIVPALADEMIISHHLCAVRLGDQVENKQFFYYLLLSRSFKGHAYGFANGATVLGLRTDDIKRFEFLMPDDETLALFNKAANAFYEEIRLLLTANKKLVATRDSLLGRLYSGKLSLSEIEVVHPEADAQPHTREELVHA